MKRKILHIVLLLVFTIQVIPCREIGQLLFMGQMNEEMQQNGTEKPTDQEDFSKCLFTALEEDALHCRACIQAITMESLRKINFAHQFQEDIPTPPPLG